VAEVPDCLTCGACCVSVFDQEAFADVTPSDCERLGVRWVRRNVLFPSFFDMTLMAIDGRGVFGAIQTKWRTQRAGPLKDCSVCSCTALRGSVMNRVSCRVYDKRPEVCRTAVKPGDRACKDIRKHMLRVIQENV